jgi:cell division protease FtsH
MEYQMSTKDNSRLNMMAERPAHGPRDRATANSNDATVKQLTADVTASPMGPLEAQTYKKEWRVSCRYRHHAEEVAAEREQELLIKKLEQEAMAAAEKAMHAAGATRSAGVNRWLPNLRKTGRLDEADDDDDNVPVAAKGPAPWPVTAGRVAARLMLAKLFDSRPEVREAIKSSVPVVIVDVPDGEMMDRVASTWKDVLFDDSTRLMNAAGSGGKREQYDAVYLVMKEQPKAKDKAAAQTAALSALSLALPFIAISPLGTTHLADAIIKSSTARMVMPWIDPVTIMRVIRIVTGKRCRERLDTDTTAKLSLDDLIIAVRFDRTASECMGELRRLAAEKESKKKSRDLNLDQLHGMTEAVAWAKSTIVDINAWRAGEIAWDAVSSSVALTGPPGTGKTTFGAIFAAEAGLKFLPASLAKWQSSGEAHLGHLLRAMRQDFDSARAQAPCVLFIDEIDSFPDRAGVTHAHRDYVIEVVNALLEQIDGIAGREGLIIIGASNDLRRCDPALLRAGRFNTIVKISLPHPHELEKMLRVRLGDDLRDEDLRDVSELAAGMTGADIEKVVNDAKRIARQQQRRLTIDDLRAALVEEDTRPAELKFRSCVHEASHIIVDVIHHGPDDIFATSAVVGSHAGASVRTKLAPRAGTYREYCQMLEIILAGRVGEEMIFGEGSHGAGGESGSDLERATTLAAAMAGSVGLAGPSPLVYLGATRDAQTFVAFGEIRKSVNAELQKAATSCRELLEHHRGAVEKVARRLLQVNRIDGAEVARILSEQTSERPLEAHGSVVATTDAGFTPGSMADAAPINTQPGKLQ